VITALDDRTLRIWLRRSTGKYWPSVCQTFESSPTTLFYHDPSRKLYSGSETGLTYEFLVAEDYNKITVERTYSGHQSRVESLYFSFDNNLLLSVGRDKKFNWYSTSSGQQLGSYNLNAWGMSIAFDELTKHCFVGDFSGNILFCKLNEADCQLITTLSGHTGSVQTLLWEPEAEWLFSGSYDNTVIVWDIGTKQGRAIELNGHVDRIVGLCYDRPIKILLTCSADGHIGVWPMNVKRNETPKWLENDICQICKSPFFWNVKAMWQQKQIGLRQHHCRKCGRAVCDQCSKTRTAMPLLGYEIVQRVCNECAQTLRTDETTPLASFHDARQGTTKTDYNSKKKIFLTVGTDRTIKIWDLSSVI